MNSRSRKSWLDSETRSWKAVACSTLCYAKKPTKRRKSRQNLIRWSVHANASEMTSDDRPKRKSAFAAKKRSALLSRSDSRRKKRAASSNKRKRNAAEPKRLEWRRRDPGRTRKPPREVVADHPCPTCQIVLAEEAAAEGMFRQADATKEVAAEAVPEAVALVILEQAVVTQAAAGTKDVAMTVVTIVEMAELPEETVVGEIKCW
mmetsp:Transcript_26662/g.74642  ORF Transcript_26662/g.74642 Transcript_26662/m.74642 type:complete len:205 (-) Transcript_26662:43-657(-)